MDIDYVFENRQESVYFYQTASLNKSLEEFLNNPNYAVLLKIKDQTIEALKSKMGSDFYVKNIINEISLIFPEYSKYSREPDVEMFIFLCIGSKLVEESTHNVPRSNDSYALGIGMIKESLRQKIARKE